MNHIYICNEIGKIIITEKIIYIYTIYVIKLKEGYDIDE